MSNEHEDRKDAVRHQNMLRIGDACSPLARADEERQARWQQATLNNEIQNPHEGVPFMKRRKNIAFVTSGAVAAAAALAVWFGTLGAGAVSANTILENFKAALGRKLTINIHDIDLNDVDVSGEIILDRQGAWLTEATDTLYSEIHVMLKADNPDWDDIDAAIVVCQSPETAWTYCRGNGGSGPGFLGGKRVTVSDYLIKGHRWQTFLEKPLGAFGAMPLALSFGSGDSQVQYRFSKPQRQFVQQLLDFLLLDLGNAESAGRVIDELKLAAGNIVIEKQDDATSVLHATDIQQIGALRLPAPIELPDIDAIAKVHVTTLTYDSNCRCIVGASWSAPESLRNLGVSISIEEPEGNFDSADSLIRELNATYEVVGSEKKAGTQWDIEVKGLPITLDTSSIQWVEKSLPGLLKNLELRIFFNTKTGEVHRAEFSGIGPKQGTITLDMGKADLDPTRLKWDGWIKGCTFTPEEAQSPAMLFGRDCTVVYDQLAEDDPS